jgi:NAD(P)-dependent dehydrogenase (short-subunit alcohol dehydrogenase family)
LAADGAHVVITYLNGSVDARRVVDEILSGGGEGQVLQGDIADPDVIFRRLLGEGLRPDVALVFATPPVSSEADVAFDREQFNSFSSAYVDGFYRTWECMRASQPSSFAMFYPSTVMIERPERGFVAYAAAKAAGEQLCRYLEAIEPRGRIIVRRLPRLATDLTLALIPGGTEDPVPVMKDVLDELRRALGPGEVIEGENV